MPSYAPTMAMPVVDVSAQPGASTASGRSALAVHVISDGSVPVAPVNSQPVAIVSAAFQLAPNWAIPVVFVTDGRPVAPVTPIPVFEV